MRFEPWSLADLDGVERNGLRVVSTFSGCGGSSLGYRLAGFDVVFASEFVPLAAETYRLNSPTVEVDERDIRTLSGHELRDRFGEIDLLDGSPPCASFSTAGRRSADWGKTKAYSGRMQRTDDLFDEYCRIVEELRPRSFVAENVAGFASGVAVGYARRTIARLRAAGYHVQARVLDAQWLGVPQARRRTIILGVRTDVGPPPTFPAPQPDRVSIREALGDHIRGQIEAQSDGTGGFDVKGRRRSPHLPSATILVGTYGGNGRYPSSIVFAPEEPDPETGYDSAQQRKGRARAAFPNESLRFLHLSEVRRIQSFPDDFVLTGSHAQRWERLGRAVPPLMMAAVAGQLAPILTGVPVS